MAYSKNDLDRLVAEIDDVVDVTRGRVIELRKEMINEERVLDKREDQLKDIQRTNQNLKSEIFDTGASPEFVGVFEREVGQLHEEVNQIREIVDRISEFSEKFKEQLLSLVELETKVTKVLADLKYDK